MRRRFDVRPAARTHSSLAGGWLPSTRPVSGSFWCSGSRLLGGGLRPPSDWGFDFPPRLAFAYPQQFPVRVACELLGRRGFRKQHRTDRFSAIPRRVPFLPGARMKISKNFAGLVWIIRLSRRLSALADWIHSGTRTCFCEYRCYRWGLVPGEQAPGRRC